MDNYYQGDSIPLEITITDKDGNVIDLDTLNTIEIKLFNKMRGTVLNTYTLTSGVTKTDASNGVCDIHINNSDTATADTGTYAAQIAITNTDTEFENDTRYRYDQVDAFVINAKV
jgi:hypothetical protein